MKINLNFVYKVAFPIIYWILVAAVAIATWLIIVQKTDGGWTILLSLIAGNIIGPIAAVIWIRVTDDM